jgi:cyclase
VPAKIRVIPCLLLQNGLIVRSELFKYHQVIGDPTTQLGRYNQWSVDELVYLDISRDAVYDVRRADAKIATAGRADITGIIEEIAKVCFMPLTFGGGIRSLDDMRRRFAHGADKVTLNTLALEAPDTIGEAARAFGNQAVVVSIDVKKRDEDGRYEVWKGGHQPTGLDPVDWAREVEARGAGEILLNAIDRDGTAKGYDLDLVSAVAKATGVPVVALGGAGRWQHFVDVIREAGASAAAAANIFHFTEMSYKNAKAHLHKNGIDVRLPGGGRRGERSVGK